MTFGAELLTVLSLPGFGGCVAIQIEGRKLNISERSNPSKSKIFDCRPNVKASFFLQSIMTQPLRPGNPVFLGKLKSPTHAGYPGKDDSINQQRNCGETPDGCVRIASESRCCIRMYISGSLRNRRNSFFQYSAANRKQTVCRGAVHAFCAW